LESKDKIEDIDLEEGKIRINGKWLTEDEIRYAIKMKVSSDDYNVADLAVALRTLIDEMNKSQVLRVRMPKELVEELEALSKETEESVEAILRRIIMDHLHSPTEIEEESDEEPEIEDDEDDPEDEDYNDIEIGFRSRIVEEVAEEVEPETTVEAQPIESVAVEEEVSEVEDIEVPDEEVEEEGVDIPEDDVEEEIEIGEEEVEEEIKIPEDEDILGIEAEEEIVVDEGDLESEEPDEIGEEIVLEEEAVPDSKPDDKEEANAEEPEKKQKKRLIPRRKKLLRRRP